MAGAAVRITFAGIAVLGGLVAATPAEACSMLESDEILADELRRSDQVFVARFVGFREVPPPAGWPYMDNKVDWNLVETLKGDPPLSGTLVEADTSRPMHGTAPGPSCGPFVVHAHNVGEDVLVMMSTETCASDGACRPNAFSQALPVHSVARSERLQLIQNLIRKEHATP